MKAYIPVSCGFVDRIEDAATRKTSGEVVFAENGVKKSVLGQIKTWENVNKEEFVVLEDGTRIRMDKVVSLFGVPGPAHKL
jgi:Rho-binding antiterminator